MKVDAIVNAANTRLQMGGGVCGAIFQTAGPARLSAACDKLAPIKNGEAVITKGFALRAKYVIHTAGPVYKGGNYNEEGELRLCYLNSLETAHKNGCASIAFPLISSGIFGYPKEEAIAVATNTITTWLKVKGSDMEVSLVVFDKSAFVLPQKLLIDVKIFIDTNYDRTSGKKDDTGEAALNQAGAFSEALRLLIDAKGKTDVDVLQRANISRKLFNKILMEKEYAPDKKIVVALAVALELSLEETGVLLKRAGLALSKNVLSDVIIQYFLTNEKYDIYEINNVLFEYDQPILGV